MAINALHLSIANKSLKNFTDVKISWKDFANENLDIIGTLTTATRLS